MTFKHGILFVGIFSLGVFSSDWIKNAGRTMFLGQNYERPDFKYTQRDDASPNGDRNSNTQNNSGSKNSRRFLAGSRNPYDDNSYSSSSAKSNQVNSAYELSSEQDTEETFSWALIDRLVRSRSFDKAISLLRDYLDLNADSARGWATIARIYDKQNSVQNSIEAWLRYVDVDVDSSQTAPVVEQLKQRFLSMLTGTQQSIADNSWMIEKLNELVDIRSNDGEIHWMLASLYLEIEDDYQAQYHALMAANDPAAKKRAEEILAQLNGEVLPDDLNIPLVRYGNQYLVEVEIEGNLARLLLDTGASISGVSRAFVNNYPYIVKDTKPIRLNTASGVETSYLFKVDELRIESLSFSNHILALLPMAEQIEFDGLLGVDILGRFDFIIDQDALLLKLKPRD